ncbi:MAG: hypothetical protein ACE15C_18450 [Phycisphaerae bacterium]
MRTVLPVLAWMSLVQLACGDSTSTTTMPTTGPAGFPQAQSVLKALNENPAPLVERIEGGEINWTTGQVFAVGEGKATGVSGQQIDMAKRAARLVAARNAVYLLSGIRTGPGGRFKNIREGSITADAVVQHFEEASDSFDLATRTATVRLKMPLYGVKGMVTLGGLELARPRTEAKPPVTKPGEPKVIIIDARGSGFTPCMLPRITRPSGASVFDASQTSFDPRTADRPPVIYVSMPRHDELTPSRRNSPTPAGPDGPAIIYKAQKSPAKSPGSLVLADEDVDDMTGYVATGGLMSTGRVVVVADSPSEPASPTPTAAPSPTPTPKAGPTTSITVD